MQVKRLITRRIRKAGSGIDLVADVNAVVSVNVDEGHRQDARPETRTESPASPRSDEAGLDNRGRDKA